MAFKYGEDNIIGQRVILHANDDVFVGTLIQYDARAGIWAITEASKVLRESATLSTHKQSLIAGCGLKRFSIISEEETAFAFYL